jgi:hypothetical protein
MMTALRIGSLVAAFVLAIAPAASGQASKDPKPLSRHQLIVERVAPPFPTFPGRTLCVCQVSNPPGDPSGGGDTDVEETMVGYLNSLIHQHPNGITTVNMVCNFPFANQDGVLQTTFCTTFEVIR